MQKSLYRARTYFVNRELTLIKQKTIMEYYNIDTDYTPNITGKRNGDIAVEKNKDSFSNKEQEKDFNNFFVNNYKNKARVSLTNFELFETRDSFVITYFPKTKSIKQLDFMAFGPYEHGLQFMITQRVYDIISKYRLPIHYKIPARIDSFSQNYYLVGFPMLAKDTYDFERSTFFDYRNGMQVKFQDTEDYETADYDRITATPKRLFLKEKLEYDIIKTTSGVFFLSDIIKEFEKQKITGYRKMEGILEISL